MAFTIMLWLVNPGEQIREAEALAYTESAERELLPGAMSGVTEPPAATRLVYGVFETLGTAEEALKALEEALAANGPVRVTQRSGHTFLVPAHRVHYAVLAEVVRPKDVALADALDRPDYAG